MTCEAMLFLGRNVGSMGYKGSGTMYIRQSVKEWVLRVSSAILTIARLPGSRLGLAVPSYF